MATLAHSAFKGKGFALLELVVAVGILVVLVGGGLYAKSFIQIPPLAPGLSGKTPVDQAKQATNLFQQAANQVQDQIGDLNANQLITNHQPLVTDTSAWKTYRNEQYGFEFKYPPMFSPGASDMKNEMRKEIIDLDLSKDRDSLGNKYCYLGVEVDERLFDKVKDGEEFSPDYPLEDIKAGNENAYLTEDYSLDASAHVVYVPHNNITLVLTFSDCSGSLDNNNVLTYKDSILSTFKFIEPTESYIACGCGCCNSDSPKKEMCLYRSQGNSIESIILEDKKARNSPSCSVVGCSLGIRYRYCD